MKTQMALALLRDCHYYGANVHAFVIMSNHIHLLLTPGPEETISNLMRNIKRRSTNLLMPFLNDNEKSQLSMQSGLNQHEFWKEGFRGNPMHTSKVFRQKANYVHQNPVRAGLCELPELYHWNSAMLYVKGLAADEYLLDLAKCISFYEELH